MLLEVFTDGGSRGNPGPAAFGFVITKDGRIVKEDKGFLGIETNNFAEYTAVIEALTWLSQNFKGEPIKFYLDSQLVVRQLTGLYKVKNPKIRELVFKIRQQEANLGPVSYSHIQREQNQEADRLVNKALDEHYGI